VHVDPDRIQQIVWNLLANAVKFTPERGKIYVRMRRNEGTVYIEVIDTGIGIKPDFLPYVFDRFRQGEAGSARRFAGIGLGLAIAKQLAELHGGTIRASSEGEGKGATFTVLLPLERRSETFDPEKIVEGNNLAIDLHGVEVLIVEDVTAARQAEQLLLEGAGAQVRSATCAALALEAFAARRPDIVVADIGMPDEDGYSMMKRLRQIEQEERTTRVPAIAVTAFARAEDRQRALAAGFDDHLPKPINPDLLMTTIARLTRLTRSTGEEPVSDS
jgi:CheY-like chemotaxis protein/anti-sigma regulatory factor (Ser/Thr protein kinase)